MSGLSESQLHYLQDVLGVQSVVLSPELLKAQESAAPVFRMSGEISGRRLLILASAPKGFPLEGAAGELAHKMIQAMRLRPDDVVILEWTQTPGAAAPLEVMKIWSSYQGVALSFGEEAGVALGGSIARSGQWIRTAVNRTMVTDSPELLLREPARKKSAWAHLQMVMKELA